MFLWFTVVSLWCTVTNAIGNDLLMEGLEKISSRDYFSNKLADSINQFRPNISGTCRTQILYYGLALAKKSKPLWALKMFDAMGKIPSGILEGNVAELGSFDECLNIEDKVFLSEKISGKYCIGSFSLLNVFAATQGEKTVLPLADLTPRADAEAGLNPYLLVGVQHGTCLPAACSTSDIQNIYNMLSIPLTFYDETCQTKANKPDLNRFDYLMISFLAIILLIMLVSTVYDVYLYYAQEEPISSALLAFSVFTNGKQLLKVSKGKGQINCLHGIRVISTMWVILAHEYVLYLGLPFKNYVYAFKKLNDLSIMMFLGAFVSVDTFFLVGGIVLAYAFLVSQEKGAKLNIISDYIHRYIRLTPPVIVVICFYLTLMKHLGSGPLWPILTGYHLVKPCTTDWWKGLLHIQNIKFLVEDNTCFGQSWYVSMDFQLFLLSPLFLIPLKKWPIKAILFIGAVAVCTVIGAFVTTWVLDLRINQFMNLTGEKLFNFNAYFYLATWIRCTPWLIGLIVGYIIYKVKQRTTKIELHIGLVLVLWIISLVTMYLCVFQGHGLIVDELSNEYNRLASSFHNALVRPAWAIAISWVIFACVTGYGGLVNWFLSMPIFQVTSKITYSMFLLHIIVLFFTNAQLTSPYTFTHANIIYTFWSDLIVVIVVSAVFSLAFEYPTIALEKWARQSLRTKRQQNEENKHEA